VEIKKYINEVSENIYTFELGRFLSIQGVIYDKFKFDGEGIDLIDKYLFQIIEEIQEVNASDEEYVLEELIDVMMYLGSAYYVFNSFHSYNTVTITKQNNSLSIKSVMDDVFSSIINARRMYPERKWHKTYSEDKILKDRNKIFSDILISLIMKIAELILTNFYAPTVDNTIQDKQKFINDIDVELLKYNLQGNDAIAFEQLKDNIKKYPFNKREAENSTYGYLTKEVDLSHKDAVKAIINAWKAIDKK
jgi:hypothetical protein